jgi:hypothetical protein
MKHILIILFWSLTCQFYGQYTYQLAVLKYKGGGDYYANPTALPNLITFFNKEFSSKISPEVPYVEASGTELYSYPFIHMTGHGNVVFSPAEKENLRNYLLAGGFLHVDDNYGMDEYIRRELNNLFPTEKLEELPNNHAIYNQYFKFNGLPKIHEHDGKKAQAFGITVGGRLVCLYTFETDLSDGWENKEVHNDPEEKRKQALQMGANILMYAFTN